MKKLTTIIILVMVVFAGSLASAENAGIQIINLNTLEGIRAFAGLGLYKYGNITETGSQVFPFQAPLGDSISRPDGYVLFNVKGGIMTYLRVPHELKSTICHNSDEFALVAKNIAPGMGYAVGIFNLSKGKEVTKHELNTMEDLPTFKRFNENSELYIIDSKIMTDYVVFYRLDGTKICSSLGYNW